MKVCRRYFVILCLSLLSIRIPVAQTTTGRPPVGLRNFPRRFARDEWKIWTSPFRPKNYSSRTATKYGIPFAIISGVLIATDFKTGNLLPNSKDQAVWAGRVSQLGAAYTLAGMSGATYLAGRLGHNAHATETGLLGLEAIGHTQIVVLVLKELTNRERPLERDQRGGFWEGGTSFPSGHAASSFALATVFAYEYREHIAVPITAYSLAAIISASRIAAQRHWLSDVVVGGSLGFLIGRFTYKRNHDPRLPGSPVARSERVVPRVGINHSSLTLSWWF